MTNSKPDFSFLGKYIITADIKLLTGLHIGGTDEGFDIGGLDNPVIKNTINGVPYIPGSSLKGKMRSLLEWAHDCVHIEQDKKTKEFKAGPCNKPECNSKISIVFGLAAEAHGNTLKDPEKIPGPTRLTVRDAFPDEKQIEKWDRELGEKIYTENKTENAIDRLTSRANPRNMERVPADSIFKAEFVYDVYRPTDRQHLKLLFEGMMLLQDTYLGGGGTRGSGRVVFENIKVEARDRSHYVGGNSAGLAVKVDEEAKTAQNFRDRFDTIFPEISQNPKGQ
ncbi:MAG: type III-A CRISPR-associated RAMP protein Csm3 [Desulfobulbaceae bacterium DB1]|nr:MAG: type III-A CRISPR-associated RAMP protein Csm3 [Desulfobulbaceae bacterium DB1]